MEAAIRNAIVFDDPDNSIPPMQTHVNVAQQRIGRPEDKEKNDAPENCKSLLSVNHDVHRDELFLYSKLLLPGGRLVAAVCSMRLPLHNLTYNGSSLA